MTPLIESQIQSIIVMTLCGVTVSIVYYACSVFIEKIMPKNIPATWILRILNYIVSAILISEYMMFCQNGKITFSGLASLFLGIWLWRKFFYDRIYAGEEDEQKGKKTSGIRKK